MKEKPSVPVNRCARSNCKHAGVIVPGQRALLCLAHQGAKAARKYRNRPEWSELANRRFDSAAERRYCEDLLTLEKAGAISDLKFQVTMPLYGANDKRVGSYRADAVYNDANGFHVIDVKGMRTALFNFKAKVFEAFYGYPIEVVYPETRRKRGKT
jgi:hypothetical protein